ncbi:MAG: DUF1501 domain-containing protein [Planctomycetes bacterium]|nr:DUF1501 domain-containing protein [Planctomycetota bacterium]
MNLEFLKRADDLRRRDFLRFTALSLLGVSFAARASADPASAAATNRASRPTAKNIIYLYMSGGMSHLDTFDTKPGTKVQGPVESIATSADGVRISEYFPLVARQMHHVAVMRSLTSNQGAHEQGNYFMHTSYTLRGTVQHPSLGAWMLKFAGRTNATIPGSVVIGGGSNYPGSGYLEPQYDPVLLGRATDGLKYSKRFKGVTADEFTRRQQALMAFSQSFAAANPIEPVNAYQDAYDQAVTLMRSSDLDAFSITDESKASRDAYGDTPFGQGCLLARRLIEHDVRYVEVDLGGWDTHAQNFERVSEQAAILDRGLSALLAELHQRGLLEETLVVLTTEFGRSPEITDNLGRNHHPRAFCGLLAGGGIRGGQAYGATDASGIAVADNPVTIPDFNATIAYAARLPLDTVVHSPAGRPFTLADKGRPVLAVM